MDNKTKKNFNAKKNVPQPKFGKNSTQNSLRVVKTNQKAITSALSIKSENTDMQVELALLKSENKRLIEERRLTKQKKVTKKEDKKWYDYLWDIGKQVVPKVGSMLLGMGDYQQENMFSTSDLPRSNSLLAASSNGKVGSQVPYMHESGEVVRVCHREYIGDIYSSTLPFQAFSLPINPGMNETFPWLSPIANQFTAYNLKGAVIEFVSEGSEYTNSAGLGYVGIAVQYDSADPQIVSKRDLLNSQFANAAKPSTSFQSWIECKPSSKPLDQLYIRSGPTPSGTDLRMYDMGRITVAVGGNTVSDVIIGELWITYDVELLLPMGTQNMAPNNAFFSCVYNTCSNTDTLGTSVTVDANSTLLFDKLSTDPQVLVIPPLYVGIFDFYYIATSSVGVTSSSILSSLVTYSGGTGSISLLQVIGGGGSGSTVIAGRYSMRLTGDGGLLTFATSGSNMYASGGYGRIRVYQVPQLGFDDPNFFDRRGIERDGRYSNFMDKITETTRKTNFEGIRSTSCYSIGLIDKQCTVKNIKTNRFYNCSADFLKQSSSLDDYDFDLNCVTLIQTFDPTTRKVNRNC